MVDQSYSIRPATEHDIPFLWEMLYESLYVPEGHAHFARTVIHEPELSKYVEGWGRAGDVGYIAVEGGGKPVGSITSRYFDENNKGYGYVGIGTPELGMAIKAEYRGIGIGKALLSKLMEELKETGVGSVSLSVDPNNAPAVKLYRNFGFETVGLSGTSITMVARL